MVPPWKVNRSEKTATTVVKKAEDLSWLKNVRQCEWKAGLTFSLSDRLFNYWRFSKRLLALRGWNFLAKVFFPLGDTCCILNMVCAYNFSLANDELFFKGGSFLGVMYSTMIKQLSSFYPLKPMLFFRAHTFPAFRELECQVGNKAKYTFGTLFFSENEGSLVGFYESTIQGYKALP